MKDELINKINLKHKLIYFLPAIPFLGLIVMLLYSCYNDDIQDMLCIKQSDNTVCCFLIQMWSVIILLMHLNILLS